MRDGDVHSQGARAHSSQQKVCRAIPGTRNGLLQFWSPARQLGKPKQAITQMVVAAVSPIAWTAQGVITSRIHRFAAPSTDRALGIAKRPDTKPQQGLPLRRGEVTGAGVSHNPAPALSCAARKPCRR